MPLPRYSPSADVLYLVYVFYILPCVCFACFLDLFPFVNLRPTGNAITNNHDAFLYVYTISYLMHCTEVAGGFTCPAAGEVSGASGSFSRHAHPEDCRKYYICLEGIAREYGCPIGTVFKIGDADGSGACEDPEDVPGW